MVNDNGKLCAGLSANPGHLESGWFVVCLGESAGVRGAEARGGRGPEPPDSAVRNFVLLVPSGEARQHDVPP
jgi:hypothetical protein